MDKHLHTALGVGCQGLQDFCFLVTCQYMKLIPGQHQHRG